MSFLNGVSGIPLASQQEYIQNAATTNQTEPNPWQSQISAGLGLGITISKSSNKSSLSSCEGSATLIRQGTLAVPKDRAQSPLVDIPLSPSKITNLRSSESLTEPKPKIPEGQPGAIEGTPEITAPSRIDGKTQISKNTWAITMICARGRNHAQLAIEGIDDAGQFLRVAHFVSENSLFGLISLDGVGTVKYDPRKNYPSGKLEFDGQTETYRVPRTRMEVMLNQIEREANARVENPKQFSILGRGSSLTTGKIHVHGEGVKDLSTVSYLFHTLLDVASPINESVNFLLSPLKWVFSKKEPTYLDYPKFDPNKFYKPMPCGPIDDIFPPIPGTCPRNYRERALFNLYHDLKEKHGYWRVELLEPDNCFTWARGKLKMLGIYLPRATINNMVSLTRIVTNPSGCSIKCASLAKCS